MEIKTEYFNEVFESGGEVRERYRPLFEALERMGEEEFATRCKRAGERLRELGAIFPPPLYLLHGEVLCSTLLV